MVFIFIFKKLDLMVVWSIYFPEALGESSEDVTTYQAGASSENTQNRIDTGELSCSV